MNPKEHVIHEVTLIGEGDICAVWVKGKKPIDEFEDAAIHYMRECFDEEVSVLEVTHERWRVVPMPDFESRFIKGEGRGSFPVTVATFLPWDR